MADAARLAGPAAPGPEPLKRRPQPACHSPSHLPKQATRVVCTVYNTCLLSCTVKDVLYTDSTIVPVIVPNTSSCDRAVINNLIILDPNSRLNSDSGSSLGLEAHYQLAAGIVSMHQTSYLLSQTPRLLSAPERSSSPATLARAREFLARNAPRSDLDAAAAVAMYPGGYAPSQDTGLCSVAQLQFGGIPFENNRSATHRGQLHHPARNTDQALQACYAPRSMMGSSASASSPASPVSLHGTWKSTSGVGYPALSDSPPPSLPSGAPASTARPYWGRAVWAAEALADMATDEGATEAYTIVQIDVIDSPEEAEQNLQIDHSIVSATPEFCPATPEQALTDGLRHIHLACTEGQVQQIVYPLAVALGAKRTEAGTVKALHAVLLQLASWPRMSNHEACALTRASLSNFSKWRRNVQNVRLLALKYPPYVIPRASSLASLAQDTPAAASAPLTWGNAPPS